MKTLPEIKITPTEFYGIYIYQDAHGYQLSSDLFHEKNFEGASNS